MCGRFAVDSQVNELIEEFVASGHNVQDWRPSWNIVPTQQVPVVRAHNGARELELVRWGIVPPSSPTFGGGKPIFNARIETVATNGLFRGPFATHRCIVPARGYYEWQVRENGKQPFFIHEPDATMAMAGIIRPWADRTRGEGDPDRWRLSMAIITTDAHVAPGEVHDRMPGFLTPASYDDWLGDHLGTAELLAMLGRTSLEVADRLEYYPVSTRVNSVRNNGPELIDHPG